MKWNMYDVFGIPIVSGLLVIPPRVSVVPIKGTVLEMVGPSASIKGCSIMGWPKTALAEYEPKLFRGMPTSLMKMFTCAALAQERPASAPLQALTGQSALISAQVSPVAILGVTHPRWLVSSITAFWPLNVVGVNTSEARAGACVRTRVAAILAATKSNFLIE
jgi:hypothetical protein